MQVDVVEAHGADVIVRLHGARENQPPAPPVALVLGLELGQLDLAFGESFPFFPSRPVTRKKGPKVTLPACHSAAK
jgi:hypothetical protein